jgi:flagellar motor switch/type III secretory pathway protein FliN
MAMAEEAVLAREVHKPLEPATGGGASAASSAEPGSKPEVEEDARWRPVLGLPCELTVELPLPDFKIADLLSLRAGAVIEARWRVGQDVPLRLNGTLIGWSEFEVVGRNLAVRLTELA